LSIGNRREMGPIFFKYGIKWSKKLHSSLQLYFVPKLINRMHNLFVYESIPAFNFIRHLSFIAFLSFSVFFSINLINLFIQSHSVSAFIGVLQLQQSNRLLFTTNALKAFQ
jgi:hypothetical protein